MNVYQVNAKLEKNLQSLVVVGELNSYDQFLFANGKIKHWEPPLFKWKDDGKLEPKLRECKDAVFVFDAGVYMAVNKRTKETLYEPLKKYIQFLPIRVVGEEDDSWYLINVFNSLQSALNVDRSEFKMRANGSRGRLTKAIFSNNIPNNSAFTYPESARNFMVKGEFLKELVDQYHLTGFIFETYKADNT